MLNKGVCNAVKHVLTRLNILYEATLLIQFLKKFFHRKSGLNYVDLGPKLGNVAPPLQSSFGAP